MNVFDTTGDVRIRHGDVYFYRVGVDWFYRFSFSDTINEAIILPPELEDDPHEPIPEEDLVLLVTYKLLQ